MSTFVPDQMRGTLIALRQAGTWSPDEDCSEIAEKIRDFFQHGKIATLLVVKGPAECKYLSSPEGLPALEGIPQFFHYPFISGGDEVYQYHTFVLDYVGKQLYVLDGTAPNASCVIPIDQMLDYIVKQNKGTVYWWFGEFKTNVSSIRAIDHISFSGR